MTDYAGPYRIIGTSGSNAPVTVSAPAVAVPVHVKLVTVKYSGTVTQNVTVTLNSGAGAGYDVVLNTIAISSGTTGFWIPAFPLPVAADDTIDVTAPAGGSGVTCAIAIYCDRQMS